MERMVVFTILWILVRSAPGWSPARSKRVPARRSWVTGCGQSAQHPPMVTAWFARGQWPEGLGDGQVTLVRRSAALSTDCHRHVQIAGRPDGGDVDRRVTALRADHQMLPRIVVPTVSRCSQRHGARTIW